MRRVGDIALLVVQWALVLTGVGGLFFNLYSYWRVPDWIPPMPEAMTGESVFRIDMRFTVLVQGLIFSLTAIGLGAVLFYLRRLYLSRRK